MAQWTPGSFVQQILDWDIEPSSADYAHFEFVAEVATGLDDVPLFAAAVVRRLPSSLASTILENLYDAVPHAFDIATSEQLLGIGPHIGSAASVAGFLISRLSVSPDHMLSRLFALIRNTTDNHVVDQYAFACWTILRGESLLVLENKTVGCLASVDANELDTVLSLPHLSDYARETLTDCRP